MWLLRWHRDKYFNITANDVNFFHLSFNDSDYFDPILKG